MRCGSRRRRRTPWCVSLSGCGADGIVAGGSPVAGDNAGAPPAEVPVEEPAAPAAPPQRMFRPTGRCLLRELRPQPVLRGGPRCTAANLATARAWTATTTASPASNCSGLLRRPGDPTWMQRSQEGPRGGSGERADGVEGPVQADGGEHVAGGDAARSGPHPHPRWRRRPGRRRPTGRRYPSRGTRSGPRWWR